MVDLNLLFCLVNFLLGIIIGLVADSFKSLILGLILSNIGLGLVYFMVKQAGEHGG